MKTKLTLTEMEERMENMRRALFDEMVRCGPLVDMIRENLTKLRTQFLEALKDADDAQKTTGQTQATP